MPRKIKPFDDSFQKDRRRTTEDASTDTSAFDAYRQGVELTSPTHFANGIAKIHSGYNGQSGNHEVPTLVLGQGRSRKRDENSFLEGVKLNPLDRFDDPVVVVLPTFFDLFGADLAHLWDAYDGATWTDSVGGVNASPQTTAAAVGTVNGHTYPVFNGTDTGMEGADATTLDGATDWCIFGAFKTNNGQAYGAIIDHAQQFYVELNFGAGAMIVTNQAAGELDGAISVDDDQWHRFVVTVTAGAGKLYVDGVLDDSDTFDPLPAAANPYLFGVQPNATVTDSKVAVVGIATRGLTVSEVDALDRILAAYVA